MTGYFTVNAPFAPNLTNDEFTPTDFKFADGVQVLLDANGDTTNYSVTTDSLGRVTQYDFETIGPPTMDVPQSAIFAYYGVTPADPPFPAQMNAGSAGDQGISSGDSFKAGFLTSQTRPSVAPEPSTFALLSSGGLGLVAMMRRRLRRSA